MPSGGWRMTTAWTGPRRTASSRATSSTPGTRASTPPTVAASLQAAGFALRAEIVWQKQHFALSRGDYHYGHEPCWYAVRTGRTSRWQGDRTQSTVWAIPNRNPFGGHATGADADTGHATQKPVALFEIPIRKPHGATVRRSTTRSPAAGRP